VGESFLTEKIGILSANLMEQVEKGFRLILDLR
jgi:hypothetical protein